MTESLLEQLKNPQMQEAIAQILTQIVAFLIFLWILKRFAWRPVVGLLEQRRQKISDEFDRIDQLEEKFKELRKEYEQKLGTIDAEARRRIQEAINEGRQIALEIKEDARLQARDIILRGKRNVELEVARARETLKEDIADMVIEATEKLLRKELDPEEQRKLILSFIDQIESASGEYKNEWR